MRMHRDQVIARIVDAYLGNVSDARKAHPQDAEYYRQVSFMWRLLEIFDLAMEQEDIAATSRKRVLEKVMMAAPDPTEALKRIELLKDVKINPDWEWDRWKRE